MALSFLLNGEKITVEHAAPTTTLLDWLREHRRLTGTKEGCNEGDCGACTVVLSGLENDDLTHKALNACILFLPQLAGKALRTVEGLAGPEGQLHPVQEAMLRSHGSQCGFCTPGIVMSLYAAYRMGRKDYENVLAGNLCRCTGYAPIIEAAKLAETLPAASWDHDETNALKELAAEDMSLDGAHLPHNIDALADLTARYPEATLVAGATDVGLWVTKAFRPVEPMIFLHRVSELKQIKTDGSGLRIGAAAPVETLMKVLSERFPGLSALLERYGSVQVRNAATLGGNIANGSPIGDGSPALIALDATLRLRQQEEIRDIPLEDFFLTYGQQDRKPGEFVESLFIPDQPHNLRCYKISKRRDQDISAVCGCFNVIRQAGKITAAHLAFGGLAGTPKRATKAESILIGTAFTAENIALAAAQISADFTPLTDMRATAEYRLKTAQNLLIRYFLEENGHPQTSLETLMVTP